MCTEALKLNIIKFQGRSYYTSLYPDVSNQLGNNTVMIIQCVDRLTFGSIEVLLQ